MKNIDIIQGGNGNLSLIPNGQNTQVRIIPDSVAQSPAQSNLIYLFDPVYYNGYTTGNGENYIAYLKNIFNKYSSVLPASNYVFTKGKILNKNDPDNLERKQYFDKSNFVFAYEKYDDNTDIPVTNKCKISSLVESFNYGVKERQKALLRLDRLVENQFTFLEGNMSKTFSCFIKLKGPVQHRSKYGKRIIREKKGIFLNTKEFSIGYRSPHYYRTGQTQSYKFVFEPFSFVFAFRDASRHHTLMTDFKFEFNKFYHLAVTSEVGAYDPITNLAPVTLKVYINGELQNCAYTTFNPLYIGTAINRTKSSRTNESIIQPGFYKNDGTVFSPIQNQNQFYSVGSNQLGYSSSLWLGKSNLSPAGKSIDGGDPFGSARKMTKRFLNNIDVGVIHIYNSVLSNLDIQKIYNVFGPRYQ